MAQHPDHKLNSKKKRKRKEGAARACSNIKEWGEKGRGG